MEIKKILILRFSSIGDIVLTTPIIRCAKKQLNNAEIHFVVNETYKDTLIHNPNIDKLYTFKKDVSELYTQLKNENYDVVIDLHKNRKSFRLKLKLGVKSYTLNKINIQKFVAVNFKWLTKLPKQHIVNRYFETLAPLNVTNDNKGLDYFIKESDSINVTNLFFNGSATKYIALVAGGSYFTKQIPLNKLIEICTYSKLPIVILGGKSEHKIGEQLKIQFSHVINACGNYSLNQSASILQQAKWVISSDTGLMHIAAAFNKNIISVWGNTIPEFGMSPYLPQAENRIVENKGLKCRPCSKLGYKKCPIGNFNCMNELNFSFVSELE